MKNLLIVCMIFCSFNVFADANKSLIIDVRSAEEYKAGHIDGAIHIPYQEIADKISVYAPSKNENIVLYCARGGRAEKALNTLEKLGYTQAKNAGGIDDLRAQLKAPSPPK